MSCIGFYVCALSCSLWSLSSFRYESLLLVSQPGALCSLPPFPPTTDLLFCLGRIHESSFGSSPGQVHFIDPVPIHNRGYRSPFPRYRTDRHPTFPITVKVLSTVASDYFLLKSRNLENNPTGGGENNLIRTDYSPVNPTKEINKLKAPGPDSEPSCCEASALQ